MSIVCEYKSPRRYVTLNKNNKDNIIEIANRNDSFYYGASPKLNTSKIIEAIVNKVFFTKESFKSFIYDNNDLMMLHVNQQQYLEALYAKILLQASSRFGIRLLFSNNFNYENFLSKISTFSNYENIAYRLNCQKINTLNQNDFIILGSCPLELIECINNNFKIITNENGLYFCDDGNYNLLDLYNDKELLKKYIKLVSGDVHYSGVLPRLIKMDDKFNYANGNIDILKLSIERTTFFTVDGFDSVRINQHPFLDEYKDILDDFYNYEDSLYNEYLFNNKDTLIYENINKYLEKSMGTNIIGVTGNIETIDGYYLLAQRASSAIDSGLLYPSVNGQSEIYDQDVDFYNESVYEDMPTIKINETSRIDFNGELNRESIAELFLLDFLDEWDYYGISILGINNSINKEIHSRRMHFNILACNKTNKDLYGVAQNIDKATEKFENKKFFALKVNLYKNRWHVVWKFFLDLFKGVLKLEPFILSLFTIILLINAIGSLSSSLAVIETSLNIVFFVLSFIYTIPSLRNWIKKRRKLRNTRKTFTIIKKVDFMENVRPLTNKVIKKIKRRDQNVDYQPISELMLLLYFMDINKKVNK